MLTRIQIPVSQTRAGQIPGFASLDIRLATSFTARLRGLLGYPRLACGQALWIFPCNGVHTFGMTYAIDVLFLDAQCRLLKAVSRLPPLRIQGCRRAVSVLELAAGSIQAFALGNSECDNIDFFSRLQGFFHEQSIYQRNRQRG